MHESKSGSRSGRLSRRTSEQWVPWELPVPWSSNMILRWAAKLSFGAYPILLIPSSRIINEELTTSCLSVPGLCISVGVIHRAFTWGKKDLTMRTRWEIFVITRGSSECQDKRCSGAVTWLEMGAREIVQNWIYKARTWLWWRLYVYTYSNKNSLSPSFIHLKLQKHLLSFSNNEKSQESLKVIYIFGGGCW